MSPASWNRIVPRGVRLRSKMRWKNGRWRLATPDRVVLEDVIVPGVIATGGVERALDVGVAWYTRSYPRLFRGVDYWSVDFNPDNARYRNGQHHTLSMTRLTDVFEPDTFDFVLCNGVFGWGLNERDQAAEAIEACATVLRPGGWLVIGWNDVPGRRVDGLHDLLDVRFERATLPAVGDDRLITDTPYRHQYEFFRAR
ncbi:class I SAM-dependent methyltransferase [Microbacterium sp. BWT-B31]|uniref:class I SAM-dependent methyltransferase n=1 Tax=Microbacterium sp. BWT-B31 TaxID=3232072 RepID=UPI003526E987